VNEMSEEKNINFIEASELRPSSSIELEKMSRGIKIRVKLYSCDDVESIDKIQKEAEARFDKLLSKYKDVE
jgi:hypothetical protein